MSNKVFDDETILDGFKRLGDIIESQQQLNKTLKITFWAKKHKKHITRNAKWTELCRYFTSKDGVPCMTYYDLDNEGYRTATTTWKVQL